MVEGDTGEDLVVNDTPHIVYTRFSWIDGTIVIALRCSRPVMPSCRRAAAASAAWSGENWFPPSLLSLVSTKAKT